jgi:hypothetical protein
MKQPIQRISMKLVFCKYIVRNGKRIYPRNAQAFRFWVKTKKAN